LQRERTAWWQLPNLLSLDAPLVAVAWLWMFRRFYHVRYQDPSVYWLLFGAVWAIYVFDRLGDVRRNPSLQRGRHHFHWRWRYVFLPLALLVALAIPVGALFGLPVSMFWHGPLSLPETASGWIYALMAHGPLVLMFTVLFFLVSRIAGESLEGQICKNAVAAFTFSLGTAMGAHYYTYESPIGMVVSFEALGFAFLCFMNLNAIEFWEREEQQQGDIPRREFMVSIPLLAMGFISLLAATFGHEYHKPFHYSLLLASAGLIMLDHFRTRLSATLMRVLADVVLILPLPVFWFWFKA